MTKHFFVQKILSCFLCITLLTLPTHVSSMTIGEERRIGEKLLYSVRGEFTVLDDPDIHQYINRLGQNVLNIVGPQFFDYHFFVVQSSQFNAFAAPAGLVFFYTGLIKTMKSEDELMSVLAHEIGHVVSRHISQRIDQSTKVSAATLALGIAGLALGVPALSQGILAGSLAAGQAIQLQYSRNDEEQADRLSFEWMHEMHRNPKAMVGMLRTMRRIARYSSGQYPQYLLTHPDPEARLDYVQSLVELDESQQQPAYYVPTDNFSFLRFKYRILQETMDPEKLRVFCSNAAASDSDKEQAIMARFGLALVEADEHNIDRALELLNEVKNRYKDKYVLDIDEAVIYAESQQFDRAKAILDKIVYRHPGDMYGVNQLALVEYKLGNLKKAEQLFARVAKDLPQNAEIYYELGRLSADKGEQGVSRFYLGKYYLFKGRVKTARQYLESVSKEKELPEKLQNEALEILDKLKKLEKEK
ncbi:M48 family metalloprotease [Desulfogranum marinum]|uniref:beta-barrel assembly-enhancing protease n=1 Tax=Desulfogranum marinum TaxID=453220 RepID=UPI0029C73042|nr:M48 family metalloprotease [Desulfogranum marinum]